MRRSHQKFGLNRYKELAPFSKEISEKYLAGKTTVDLAEEYESDKGNYSLSLNKK